jgi:hypothetical protein
MRKRITVKDIKGLFISKVKIINNHVGGMTLFEGNVDNISGNILDREVSGIDTELDCIIRIYVE